MGIGGALVVFFSVAASLTFMPALIYRLSWHHRAVEEKEVLQEDTA